jgi:hypothetical protein
VQSCTGSVQGQKTTSKFLRLVLDIPSHRIPLLEDSLEGAELLLCFECNQQDFINEAGFAYADCTRNPALVDILRRPGFEKDSGFAFFASYLWNNFTQAVPSASFASGTKAPIFSEFLLRRLQLSDWQRVMTEDGKVKYKIAMELFTQFTWYVAIKALQSGVADWRDKDFKRAKKQRQELVEKKRELYCSKI